MCVCVCVCVCVCERKSTYLTLAKQRANFLHLLAVGGNHTWEARICLLESNKKTNKKYCLRMCVCVKITYYGRSFNAVCAYTARAFACVRVCVYTDIDAAYVSVCNGGGEQIFTT